MNDFFKSIPSKWRGWAYVAVAVVTFALGVYQTIEAVTTAAQANGAAVTSSAIIVAVLNYLMTFVGITARVNLTPDTTVSVIQEAAKDAQDEFSEDSTDAAEADVTTEDTQS